MHVEFSNGEFVVVAESGEKRPLTKMLQELFIREHPYSNDPITRHLRTFIYDVDKHTRESPTSEIAGA